MDTSKHISVKSGGGVRKDVNASPKHSIKKLRSINVIVAPITSYEKIHMSTISLPLSILNQALAGGMCTVPAYFVPLADYKFFAANAIPRNPKKKTN